MKRYIYEYKVTGVRSFPYDMLRYDRCYPHDSVAVGNMTDEEETRTRTVTLNSHREPTKERWESFGWYVSDVRKLLT